MKEKKKARKVFDGERIYTIPLTEALKKARRKRVPYAIRLVRSFIETHTKSKNVKLGKFLNEAVWTRGIRKVPRKVRVKVIRVGSEVRAELIDREYQAFKAKPVKERKGMREKLMERLGPKAIQKEEEEKKIEGRKESPETKKKEEPAAAKKE